MDNAKARGRSHQTLLAVTFEHMFRDTAWHNPNPAAPEIPLHHVLLDASEAESLALEMVCLEVWRF